MLRVLVRLKCLNFQQSSRVDQLGRPIRWANFCRLAGMWIWKKNQAKFKFTLSSAWWPPSSFLSLHFPRSALSLSFITARRSHCANLRIFLPLIFYMKSIFANFECAKIVKIIRFEIYKNLCSRKILVAGNFLNFHTVVLQLLMTALDYLHEMRRLLFRRCQTSQGVF